jgi:hypothetical protein
MAHVGYWHNRHGPMSAACPLSGVERTWPGRCGTFASRKSYLPSPTCATSASASAFRASPPGSSPTLAKSSLSAARIFGLRTEFQDTVFGRFVERLSPVEKRALDQVARGWQQLTEANIVAPHCAGEQTTTEAAS